MVWHYLEYKQNKKKEQQLADCSCSLIIHRGNIGRSAQPRCINDTTTHFTDLGTEG